MTAQAGDTSEHKRALRRQLRQQRAALSPAQKNAAAARALCHLQGLRMWQHARHIGLYLAYASETPTDALIALAHQQHKHVYVPRITGEGLMQMHELRAHDPCQRNVYGIREPRITRPIRPLRQLDLLLIPLIGFDPNGYRLGTGGGFYDRYLARRVGHHPPCIGWAFHLQLIPAVPRAPWDQPLDGIITERGMQWPTGS